MNATAKERDCSTEKGLCEHELPSKGWFRDAFLPDVIFRPYATGPPNPKLPGGSDVPKATAREVQAINASGRLSRLFQDSFAPLREFLQLTPHLNIQIATSKGQWSRNQNQDRKINK
jgi:hypothetical protein